jgi:hypothetical protein
MVEEAIRLAYRDDHEAEVVCVDDLEGSHPLGSIGLQKVLGIIQMEVADCSVGEVLSRLAVHLEGFDLRVISCRVDAIVDDCEL